MGFSKVRSYAIFNYDWLGWTTHTEAGGDTSEGQVQFDVTLVALVFSFYINMTSYQGGVPAFVGFNAGNGTKSYAYMPYSQVC